MEDFKTYCKYLYHSTCIPVYLFRQKELIACFPDQQKATYPPDKYLKTLWESEKDISLVITQQYSYFGLVRSKDCCHNIILGPVCTFPYNKDILSDMYKEYAVSPSPRKDFFAFFSIVPSLSRDIFINKLLFINYTLNNTSLNKSDISNYDWLIKDDSINKKHSLETYYAKEYETLYDNLPIENELLGYIESGDLEHLKEFTNRTKNVEVGTIANDNLRQFRNMLIITVTLVSRAAMKGGLEPRVAYSLSNIYYQQVERLTDPDAIISLIIQVQEDYCKRVANSITPPSSDNIIYQVIDYVHNNTNRKITVENVAKQMGFSTTYLSRKFKKELGFGLNTFIRRCKLEESKHLLAYTDKSISQISTYLCFSSQSHFQRAFKEQYGLTPYDYRKSCISTYGYK